MEEPAEGTHRLGVLEDVLLVLLLGLGQVLRARGLAVDEDAISLPGISLRGVSLRRPVAGSTGRLCGRMLGSGRRLGHSRGQRGGKQKCGGPRPQERRSHQYALRGSVVEGAIPVAEGRMTRKISA